MHISYPITEKDRFILVTNNSLNDVVNIPQPKKPIKFKNRAGFWHIKPKQVL